MKLFVDTANLEQIKEVHALGILDGVTTNPTLVAREGVDFHDRLREITSLIDGSVSAEVIALDAEGMIREGKQLADIAPNITVKVPMTAEGLKAVHAFHELGIRTNVTLIFSETQALAAARAGATYVSPFLGRLDDIGESGIELVENIANIFAIHEIETQIIAASIRNTTHITEAAMAGADIATIPYAVFSEMLQHPLTDKGIEQFLKDWESTQ